MKLTLFVALIISSTTFADTKHWCGMPVKGLMRSDAYTIEVLKNGTLKLYSVYNGGLKLTLENDLYTLVESDDRLIIVHDNGVDSFELDCDKFSM